MAKAIWAQPTAILRYHQEAQAALGFAQAALLQGVSLPVPGPFIGLTPPELNKRFAEMFTELDLQTSMAVLASYEAVLRNDFSERAEGRGPAGSQLTGHYNLLVTRYGARVPLDEILERISLCTGKSKEVGDFRSALHVRHWLAHGRCWTLKSNKSADPVLLHTVGNDLVQAIRGV